MLVGLRNVYSRTKVLWSGTVVRVLGLYRIGIVSKRSAWWGGAILTVPPLCRDLWL
jgi:hypothetical protein